MHANSSEEFYEAIIFFSIPDATKGGTEIWMTRPDGQLIPHGPQYLAAFGDALKKGTDSGNHKKKLIIHEY